VPPDAQKVTVKQRGKGCGRKREASAVGASMPVKYFAHELEVAGMLDIHHGTVQQLARGVY
jgi:hypothetical protein